MDDLNRTELQSYVRSMISKLSSERMKKILFIGLNSIKEEMDYSELQQMNVSIDTLIKNKNKKDKNKESKENKSVILKVPKNASMSKVIPSDILGKHVCSFLMMRSITNLARCDRKFAIICHSPVAVTNIMHRYDLYPYGPTSGDVYVDGDYHWKSLNGHRVKNVAKLSISSHSTRVKQRLGYFQRVKELSFIGHLHGGALIPPLSAMEKICFVDFCNYPSFHATHLAEAENLDSISFVDCPFYDLLDDYDPNDSDDADEFDPYNKLIEFILPSQANGLQTLKFINSEMPKVDHAICRTGNDAVENVERIKTSLCNLRALVYDGDSEDSNLFYYLAQSIATNLSSFKQMEALHLHSDDNNLITSLPISGFRNITELCLSLSFRNTEVLNTSSTNLFPKLQKMCIVIKISTESISCVDNFAKSISFIFRKLDLTLFQLVFSFESDRGDDRNAQFCLERFVILNKFIQKLGLIVMRNRSTKFVQRQMLFRIHIKSCHSGKEPNCQFSRYGNNGTKCAETAANVSSTLNQLILNYLITYPLGKIQLKWTYNAKSHGAFRSELGICLKGIGGMLRFVVKEGGSLNYKRNDKICDDMERHRVYAISASKKDLAEHNVHHENKWIADCKWCCNTPWI